MGDIMSAKLVAQVVDNLPAKAKERKTVDLYNVRVSYDKDKTFYNLDNAIEYFVKGLSDEYRSVINTEALAVAFKKLKIEQRMHMDKVSVTKYRAY